VLFWGRESRAGVLGRPPIDSLAPPASPLAPHTTRAHHLPLAGKLWLTVSLPLPALLVLCAADARVYGVKQDWAVVKEFTDVPKKVYTAACTASRTAACTAAGTSAERQRLLPPILPLATTVPPLVPSAGTAADTAALALLSGLCLWGSSNCPATSHQDASFQHVLSCLPLTSPRLPPTPGPATAGRARAAVRRRRTQPACGRSRPQPARVCCPPVSSKQLPSGPAASQPARLQRPRRPLTGSRRGRVAPRDRTHSCDTVHLIPTPLSALLLPPLAQKTAPPFLSCAAGPLLSSPQYQTAPMQCNRPHPCLTV
jgi:hypothetical protein